MLGYLMGLCAGFVWSALRPGRFRAACWAGPQGELWRTTARWQCTAGRRCTWPEPDTICRVVCLRAWLSGCGQGAEIHWDLPRYLCLSRMVSTTAGQHYCWAVVLLEAHRAGQQWGGPTLRQKISQNRSCAQWNVYEVTC